MTYNITNELITNVDQTPSKYVPTENVTIGEKNSKYVARKRANDKRGITVRLVESMSREVLFMQFIYKGKANRSLPAVEFPAGFLLN